jgi:hypothetical protein
VGLLRVGFLLLVSISAFSSAWGQAAAPASAKTSGHGVNGTVTDSTGAVLPGASVAITNASGVTKTVNTDAKGEYVLPGLAAGTYSITISAPKFKDFHSDGLNFTAAEDLTIDASLEPAGETTSVNVEGQKVSQVETETSQIVGTVTEKELVSLGLNGRNFTQLIALTPGVSNQTGQDEAKVGITGSVRYSVNGGRVEYNSFEIDGGDVLNAGLNGNKSTLIVYPSLDALSEVKVLTSNYGAMYGRTASGTVLAETKSGTNQFHGVAYEFIRNEMFNARNYFDAPGRTPLYRRNDFGATLGGPLYIPGIYNDKKDKTYFFFSEEFHLERTPIALGGDKTAYNQAVPSVAERMGNFSDVCPFVVAGSSGGSGGQTTFFRQNATGGKVYPDCPAIAQESTVNPCASNILLKPCPTQTWLTFPGNVVPLDPNAKIIMATGLIPPPDAGSGCNSTAGSCFDAFVSPKTYWREELFKIDHNITANMKGGFRYIHDSWDTTALSPQWGTVVNSFPTIQSSFTGPGVSMLAHVTNTISPTLLNEFIFSYTTDHITLSNLQTNFAQWQRPAGLNLGYLFNNGFGGKIPGIVIGGTNAEYGGQGFAIDPGYLPWHHSNPTYNWRDDLSKVVGKHTLQFGGQYLIAQRNELNQAVGANTGDVQGILTYSNVSSLYSTGNAFADFLLGPGLNVTRNGIKTYQQDSGQRNYYSRYQVGEPYFQDDWRINSRFTLNLGLRVSLFGVWHEKYNNIYNWVPSAFSRSLAAGLTIDTQSGDLALPGTCNSAGAFCTPIPLNLANLDPRITNGLVRCGVNGVPAGCMTGHLFNPAPRIGFAWDPVGNGKNSIRAGYGIFFEHGVGNEANAGSLEGSAPLVLDATQNSPFTYACVGGVGTGCPGAGAYPLNVTSIPTHAVWPYVQQWSLSYQRELSKNTLATIAYVGSKGTHLATELQINQLKPPLQSDNPFAPGGLAPGQPITTTLCDSYDGASFTFANPSSPTGGTQWSYLSPTGAVAHPDFINLEAACYGTAGKFFPDPNSLRTFAPGFSRVFSLQNVADSRYNAMQATVRRQAGRLTLGVSYTYSHSIDDSSDRSDTTLVNAFDLASNRASSSFDQRHLLNISYLYNLPDLSRTFTFLNHEGDQQPDSAASMPASPSRAAHLILDNWEISGITTVQSGTPFSVVNGASSDGVSVLDNAGVANGTTAGSYPDIIGDPHAQVPFLANNPASFGPALGNAGAFGAPEGLTFGNAGRNFFNNPRRTNFDISFLKHFKVTEASNLEFRAELYNFFNHTQFRIYDPDVGNTGSNIISCYGGPNNSAGDPSCLVGNAFLHPVDAHRARTVQFGLKYAF